MRSRWIGPPALRVAHARLLICGPPAAGVVFAAQTGPSREPTARRAPALAPVTLGVTRLRLCGAVRAASARSPCRVQQEIRAQQEHPGVISPSERESPSAGRGRAPGLAAPGPGPDGETGPKRPTRGRTKKRAGGSGPLASEPPVGFEPTTCSLRGNCSTPELRRRGPRLAQHTVDDPITVRGTDTNRAGWDRSGGSGRRARRAEWRSSPNRAELIEWRQSRHNQRGSRGVTPLGGGRRRQRDATGRARGIRFGASPPPYRAGPGLAQPRPAQAQARLSHARPLRNPRRSPAPGVTAQHPTPGVTAQRPTPQCSPQHLSPALKCTAAQRSGAPQPRAQEHRGSADGTVPRSR